MKQEMELKKEFKIKQTEVENLFMTTVSDVIAEYADKVGQESYKKVGELVVMLKNTMAKMTTWESFNTNLDEYSLNYNILNDKVIALDKYFMPNLQFTKEVLNLSKSYIKDRTEDLQVRIGIANYLGYNKLAYNLQFSYKKLMDVITYIINNSINETVCTYKTEINNLLIPLKVEIDLKVEQYNTLKKFNENIVEVNKKHTQKILDYKKMDKEMKEKGFEDIRQNGSHKIYSDGIKSVPVPQHRLGVGLSHKIQKQISL